MDRALWLKRWRRAVRVARFLSIIPFVRLVGLNGSMATGTMREESDIDFFIVAEPGHLYTARLFVTGALRSLRLTTTNTVTAGKICLNRYATCDNLDITEHNEYHARVFHNLMPLYAQREIGVKYWSVNQWMEKFGFAPVHNPVVVGRGFIRGSIQFLGELLCRVFPGIEAASKEVQISILSHHPYQSVSSATIVATNQEVRINAPKEVHG